MIEHFKEWLAWRFRRPNPFNFDFTDPKQTDTFNNNMAIWRGQKPRRR